MKKFILIIMALLAFAPVAKAQKLKAMDLGLSVKWANMNVGADAPEEYGDYFAWGEVKTKRYYGDYSKYKFIRTEPKVYYKYNYRFEGEGTVRDDLTTLQRDDDAATQIMGKAWRMPTQEEVEELIKECIFQWYTLNGTRGYMVTNKSVPSDTIFIPLTGYKDFGNFRLYPATMGYYWTSTLVGDEISGIDSIDPNGKLVEKAKAMLFTGSNTPIVDFIKRNIGCTIRPVSNR